MFFGYQLFNMFGVLLVFFFLIFFFVTFRHTINLTWNWRGEREEALAIVFNDTLSRSRLDICNVAGAAGWLVRYIVFRFDVV